MEGQQQSNNSSGRTALRSSTLLWSTAITTTATTCYDYTHRDQWGPEVSMISAAEGEEHQEETERIVIPSSTRREQNRTESIEPDTKTSAILASMLFFPVP